MALPKKHIIANHYPSSKPESIGKKKEIASKMSPQEKEDHFTAQMMKRAKLKSEGVRNTKRLLD